MTQLTAGGAPSRADPRPLPSAGEGGGSWVGVGPTWGTVGAGSAAVSGPPDGSSSSAGWTLGATTAATAGGTAGAVVGSTGVREGSGGSTALVTTRDVT